MLSRNMLVGNMPYWALRPYKETHRHFCKKHMIKLFSVIFQYKSYTGSQQLLDTKQNRTNVPWRNDRLSTGRLLFT